MVKLTTLLFLSESFFPKLSPFHKIISPITVPLIIRDKHFQFPLAVHQFGSLAADAPFDFIQQQIADSIFMLVCPLSMSSTLSSSRITQLWCSG